MAGKGAWNSGRGWACGLGAFLAVCAAGYAQPAPPSASPEPSTAAKGAPEADPATDTPPPGAPPAGARPAAADLTADRQRILEQVKRRDLSEAEVREWIGFADEIKKHAKHDLSVWERVERAVRDPWVFFGFAAQGVFMFRFVIQLIASERKKRSHVPVAFWYLSLAGGLMLFVYALVRRDPVFVLGQGLGIFIYARNLMLIRKRSNDRLDLLDERASRNRPASPVEGAQTP